MEIKISYEKLDIYNKARNNEQHVYNIKKSKTPRENRILTISRSPSFEWNEHRFYFNIKKVYSRRQDKCQRV